MTVAFPSSLPQPSRDGYSANPAKPKSRALMDDGFYQDKRSWGKQPFAYNLEWRFTWNQLKQFEAWLEHVILRGGEWFTLTIAGQVLTLRPISEAEIHFTPNYWVAALKVEALSNAPTIAAATGILPQWPSTLPTLEVSGYGYQKSGSFIRSEIETGLAEQRNRFRHKQTIFNGKINVTLAERNIFWAFYRDTTIDGIAWFSMPFENGFGRTMVRAKFGGTVPNETPLGAIFTIATTFETGDAPMYSKNQYLALP